MRGPRATGRDFPPRPRSVSCRGCSTDTVRLARPPAMARTRTDEGAILS